ncbi:MAG: hypothetical protein RLP02_07480 [Coleofasciculus sp. C2-GNP5-27]
MKPSNLILGKDDHIYLVDFGAVQDKAKAEGVTFTVVGTSGYVPPEQLWGKAIPASDLYALGATLIHLVTRIPPAELPQQRMQIQFKHRAKRIHPELANWIETLIQPAPEKRFQTARMALSALQNLSFQNQTPIRTHPSKTHKSITNNYDSELRDNYVWGWLSLIFCIGCLLLFVF